MGWGWYLDGKALVGADVEGGSVLMSGGGTGGVYGQDRPACTPHFAPHHQQHIPASI